jgi:hypothetical protein
VKNTENEPDLHPNEKLSIICIEFQDVNSSQSLINLNNPKNYESMILQSIIRVKYLPSKKKLREKSVPSQKQPLQKKKSDPVNQHVKKKLPSSYLKRILTKQTTEKEIKTNVGREKQNPQAKKHNNN